MTQAEARRKRALEVERRREEERRCAADYLFFGDEYGIHAKRCVYKNADVPTCSRDYYPGPVPDDVKLYEDSPLGALWGLNTQDAWQLAGWNIIRREETS